MGKTFLDKLTDLQKKAKAKDAKAKAKEKKEKDDEKAKKKEAAKQAKKKERLVARINKYINSEGSTRGFYMKQHDYMK